MRISDWSSDVCSSDLIALDRAGADDRHLYDEIIEYLGFQPRQHVDLRPAFDLEHADAVAPFQHLVDGFVIALDIDLQRPVAQPMLAHQVEAFADAGQHAEREHIDLHQPERVRSEEHTSELQSLM